MEEKNHQAPVSRRELLKALAAAGGALGVAAFLPGRWSRPLVEAGVLPAHAQGSLCAEVALAQGATDCVNAQTCQGFTTFAILAYAPTNLTVSRISVVSCNQTQPSGFRNDGAGLFTVYYNLADIQNCPDVTVTVYFREGCNGIYYETQGAKAPGRGLLG
jgi:hypothetical protein